MSRIPESTTDSNTSSPAPSRAEPLETFAPRGILQPVRTVRYKWPILLALTGFPLAVLVGAATATMNEILAVLLYPVALFLGLFFGTWTETMRDGFAGGFMAGWGGYFLGTAVGAPIQVALTADPSVAGFGVAVISGVVLGIVFGVLFGLIAGFGGLLGARAMRGLRHSSSPGAP